MNDVITKKVLNNEFTLIGEIGVNYYDIAAKENITPLDAAIKMIDEGKKSGLHAVKFQTYKAGTLASKNSPSYWDLEEENSTSQYELFKKFDSFGEKEYTTLASHCEKIGIEFLSTPFDFESADYLDNLMNVYKISSSDLTNIPFIDYQARKNKPILLSTGAANLSEIEAAVKTIRNVNNKPLVLLHCVLEYPTPKNHANLAKISSLKKYFPDIYIGYSDHTKPDDNFDVLKTAYILGAKVIEKHYTLDKTLKGNDHYHAMDASDIKKILNEISTLQNILGTANLEYCDTESDARKYARRSIVSKCNILEGETITYDKLCFKRPGTGISPADIKLVVDKVANSYIPEDTILQTDMFYERKD
jgi:N-acetylneuraminate synthase